MKKLISIIALCAVQSACVSQAPASRGDGVLLSFADLASEITVGVETADTSESDQLPDDMPLGTP
jgi:hypothetical protein